VRSCFEAFRRKAPEERQSIESFGIQAEWLWGGKRIAAFLRRKSRLLKEVLRLSIAKLKDRSA